MNSSSVCYVEIFVKIKVSGMFNGVKKLDPRKDHLGGVSFAGGVLPV